MLEINHEKSISTSKENLGEFSHEKWRLILKSLDQAMRQRYEAISIIGPFGFEPMWLASEAPRNIKRLYIYSNLPDGLDKDQLAGEIQFEALKLIKKIYPAILDDLVILIKNEEFNFLHNESYVCKPTDKLLDIQIRETTDPIILDYAEYLILVHQSILESNGESQNYQTSLRYRSRTLQLYLIQEALYKNYLPSLEMTYESLTKLICQYITNSIQIFFKAAENDAVHITEEEEEIFKKFVIKRSRLIESYLSNNHSNTILCKRSSYHDASGKIHLVNLPIKVHNELVKKVALTYEYFLDEKSY